MACRAKPSKACGDGGKMAFIGLIWVSIGGVQVSVAVAGAGFGGCKVCISRICPQMRFHFRGLNDGDRYIQ